MFRIIGKQSIRSFALCRQFPRLFKHHVHVNTPIKTISPIMIDKSQGELDLDGSLVDILPATKSSNERLVQLPLIDIGDYVEAFRNGQYSGMVVGQKKSSGGLQQLTLLLRNGKTFNLRSDSVAFCIKDFIKSEQISNIVNESIDLANVDANGLLQHIPASFTRAIQHYQRTLSLNKGLAHQDLKQLYKHFIDKKTQITLNELTSYAFKTKTPTPLQRHITFLHLVADNTQFIPSPNVRGSDIWTLRPQAECERINQVIESIRTKDPAYTDFLSHMRSLISFYNAHADPILGTFSQTALEMVPTMTSKITSTDKIYINFIVNWIRSPKVVVDSPYEVFVPTILKALKCYDDLFFDRSLAIRFLKEIGMFKPWDNVSLLENASVAREFFWSKEALESDKKMEEFKTAFLSSHTDHDKYASIRHDFGDLPVYTIDDPSAKEIDDGVSIEHIPGDDHSVWMHVHIADPTTYISPTHGLSQLMKQKVQTLYLPECHFPMLSEELSSKKFSLGSTAFKNQDGSQYAMSFSTRIDKNGNLLDYKVQPSLVKNVIKVYYDDLDQLLEPIAHIPKDPLVKFGKVFSYPSSDIFDERDAENLENKITIPENAKKDLIDIYHWANKHTQLRIKQGAILFSKPNPVIETLPELLELPSTQFSSPHYVSHLPAVRIKLDKFSYSPARQMVAETMIMGGRIASRFAAESKVPIPFRTQNWNPRASATDLRLRSELLACREPTMGMVQMKDMVHYMSILPPTTVTTQAGLPHVVMGIQDGYTRATSPLRRYLDMVVHWQLKSRLLGHSRLPFSEKQIQLLGTQIMAREKQLSLLQNKSIQFWVVSLLDRLRSNGLTNTMEWNCLINLPNYVAKTELGGAMEVTTGTILELGIPGRIEKLHRNVEVGEVVKVRISSLEPLLGRINLELIS
ncbi:uncharacterized protein BX663DRAFT_464870 [Cokeromyces recurvatus]|uniref:uncharacterized protein n=1 Tax=Cokeromyces recurvatus TaxID=90255 RepID=UPI002220095C|nr:uncharacterized protein BX663DRAFT_464870 [Cokeromyces recurvatus]KAI7908230.1 hypothetical protein BX663DRAFT_464870 [Cokeromyces recurvatus]